MRHCATQIPLYLPKEDEILYITLFCSPLLPCPEDNITMEKENITHTLKICHMKEAMTCNVEFVFSAYPLPPRVGLRCFLYSKDHVSYIVYDCTWISFLLRKKKLKKKETCIRTQRQFIPRSKSPSLNK